MEIIKEKSTTTSITPKLVDSDLTSTLSASEKIKQIGIIEDEQGRKFDITVKVVDEKGKIIAGYPDLMMLVNNEHPRYYTRSSGRLILEGDWISHSEESFDIKDNKIYIWDSNNRWKIFELQYDKNAQTVNAILEKTLRYHPDRISNIHSIQKHWKEFASIFDYENPQPSWKSSTWTIVKIPNYNKYGQTDMVVKLPEGKEFDKNSLQVYPYDQTILIQETKGNQHQYDFKFSANGYFILDERPMN